MILHEIFGAVSRFPRVISCHISEKRIAVHTCLHKSHKYTVCNGASAPAVTVQCVKRRFRVIFAQCIELSETAEKSSKYIRFLLLIKANFESKSYCTSTHLLYWYSLKTEPHTHTAVMSGRFFKYIYRCNTREKKTNLLQ